MPAYFNNTQREATIEAAKLANIQVKQLISEPTAAAVAYGLSDVEDKMILVLDLGGGTFDVSLLDLFEGVIQVEAISGDNFLGGEDFTQVLVKDFYQKNELSASDLSSIEQGVLYRKMEEGKKLLSSNTEFSISLTIGDKQYDYKQNSLGYEKLCEELLSRLTLPIMRVLKDAKLRLSDIDQVILVGGATRTAVVKRHFAKLLRKFPESNLNPDEVVSVGAAIHANIKNHTFSEELILTDVSGHSLGVEIARRTEYDVITDIFFPIIERNTTIPVSIEHVFSTIHNGQKMVDMDIFQGESPKASENLQIGKLSIKLPSNTKAGYPVACRFTYDNNGILEVIVRDPQTGVEEKTIIEENPGKLTSREIQASLEKLENLKILPADKAENRLLMARLERWYSESLGEERFFIQDKIFAFQHVLDRQNPTEIRQMYRELSKLLDSIEGDSWL